MYKVRDFDLLTGIMMGIVGVLGSDIPFLMQVVVVMIVYGAMRLCIWICLLAFYQSRRGIAALVERWWDIHLWNHYRDYYCPNPHFGSHFGWSNVPAHHRCPKCGAKMEYCKAGAAMLTMPYPDKKHIPEMRATEAALQQQFSEAK